jgi:hypothetical protein
LEKLAGAAAAMIATEKLDPGASLLTEGLAASAGFKCVEALMAHKDNSNEPAQGQHCASPAV